MEITKNNFEEFYKEFSSNLPKCEIVSFDLEMSGISCPEEFFLDIPHDRYNKQKVAATKYSIVQVGLYEFEYEVRPYYVYVFPQSYGFFSPQVTLDCSAIEFLNNNKMDWQTWIQAGVPYLTKNQAQWTQDKIFQKTSKKVDDMVVLTYVDAIERTTRIINYVADWITGKEVKIMENEINEKLKLDKQQEEEEKVKQNEYEYNEKCFKIFENSKFVRRFYYEQFEKLNYNNFASIQSKTENNIAIIYITKMTPEVIILKIKLLFLGIIITQSIS